MIQLYKPNSKNTGCAFGFQRGLSMGKNPEPCVYVTGIKQFSWDDKTKTGSFSKNQENPDKKCQIKLDEKELAGLIYAIENGVEFSAFHSFEDTKTTIVFKPYEKKGPKGGKAWSFTLTRNSTEKFGIGVELSEAQLLCEFFKYFLRYVFNHRENEYQKRREEYKK
jgi:hypothetical protein